MRVWDIHPGYLSRQSLLGQHAEIHAVHSVIAGNKKGYSDHPETMRWRGNLARLKDRHELTVKEMGLRGVKHKSPFNIDRVGFHESRTESYVDPPAKQFALLRMKYEPLAKTGRIPLPKNSSEFWSHHKYSVMGRGCQYYKQVQVFMRGRGDHPITEDDQLIGKILAFLELEFTDKGLRNVIDHIWGYFKESASQGEKQGFAELRTASFSGQIDYLFGLAQKYQREYLLHSTIFADLIERG